MAGCGKEIDYSVPTKYSYKTIKYKCGSTGIDGFPVFCGECAEKHKNVDWRAEAEANGENFDDEY